jgi:phospholipase C
VAALVAALVAVTVLLPLASAPAHASGPPARSPRGTGTATPIEHFVTLMQENHTFDNYFGTYPEADGLPDGTCMPSGRPGKCVKPWHLGRSPIDDLDRRIETFEQQYDGGRMDGFVRAAERAGMTNPRLPMGYYDGTDIPYYWNVAGEFVLFDRNFSSARAGSLPNHMFWVSAGPGAADGQVPAGGFTAPTIFDRLQGAGISWKFYVQNYDPQVTFRSRGRNDGSQVVTCPLLNYARFVDDPTLNSHIVPLDDYYEDLDADTLPAVSFIVPAGSSEHPPSSPSRGQAFVSNLVSGLMRSRSWSSSAFMWSYDDWGGWYDHVVPPAVDQDGYGFRTPALLVSPYARRGFVDHTQIDFTSQLKFIEQNWGLRPLTARDAAANGLDSAFDFESGPRAPEFVSAEVSPPDTSVPGRGVVYLCYGAGLVLAVGFVNSAVRQSHRPQPWGLPRRGAAGR